VAALEKEYLVGYIASGYLCLTVSLPVKGTVMVLKPSLRQMSLVAMSCTAALLLSLVSVAQTNTKKGGSAVPKLPGAAGAAPAKADLTDTPVNVPAGGELLYAAAPSPYVAVGHNASGKGACQVWDLATKKQFGKPLATLPPAGISPSGRVFALSRDGKHLAVAVLVGKNPGVSVWSVETGQELKKFEVNATPIFLDIMLFAGPGQIVTSKQTNQGNLFQIWDATTG
jgi:hypothetical protein